MGVLWSQNHTLKVMCTLILLFLLATLPQPGDASRALPGLKAPETIAFFFDKIKGVKSPHLGERWSSGGVGDPHVLGARAELLGIAVASRASRCYLDVVDALG
jgi:hypothetical protein